MLWRRLECFLAVGKDLNYSKAAKRLFLNQSVLTYHVQNLEQELGIKLFERNPHTVRFTPAGEELYRKISPVFEELSEIIETYNQNAKEYILRISSTYMINYKIFAPIFEDFNKTYPNVKIQPKQLDPVSALTHLCSNEIEACFAFEEEAAQYQTLDFLPLFSIRRNGILVPLSDPLANSDNFTYASLKHHTIILPQNIEDNPRLSFFYKKIQQMSASLQILYVPDMLSAYAMVSEGKGICPAIDFMPDASHNIALLYNKNDPLSVSGICTNRKNNSAYVHEFIQLLSKKYPY